MTVRFLFAFGYVFILGGLCLIFPMSLQSVSAQDDGTGQQKPITQQDYNILLAENRKLAQALAEATEKFLQMREAGQSCEGISELKQQNESLRETIKAQNAVLASGGVPSEDMAKLKQENKMLQGLKETIRELQAQNDHLSAGGNMGETVTTQIMNLQEKISEMKAETEKEKSNARVYREKMKQCEQASINMKQDSPAPQASESFEAERLSLNKEITALKLENQELKARIELLNQKAVQ